MDYPSEISVSGSLSLLDRDEVEEDLRWCGDGCCDGSSEESSDSCVLIHFLIEIKHPNETRCSDGAVMAQ